MNTRQQNYAANVVAPNQTSQPLSLSQGYMPDAKGKLYVQKPVALVGQQYLTRTNEVMVSHNVFGLMLQAQQKLNQTGDFVYTNDFKELLQDLLWVQAGRTPVSHRSGRWHSFPPRLQPT